MANSIRPYRTMLFFALIAFVFSFIKGKIGLAFLGITASFFIIAVYLKKKEDKTWKNGLGWFLDFFRDISVHFFMIYGLVIVMGLIFAIFQVKISNLDQVIENYSPSWLLILGLSAGPIEEFVFRGILLKYSRQLLAKWTTWKDVLAVVFSSAMFALAHIVTGSGVYTTLYVIPTFVLGLYLGWIYIQKGLLESMWLHSIYNMFVLFLAISFVHGGWLP